MKLDDFDLLNEAEDVVKIKGIFRNLTNDEKEIYKAIKEKSRVYKSELSEFQQQIASGMVGKGLITRKKSLRKDDEHYGELYFTAKGRMGHFARPELDEVAPPDRKTESWIKKNKKRFKEKYGKDYGKYLYGKAWNMFNGKK